MVTFDAKDGSIIKAVVQVDGLGPPDIGELGKMKRIKILLLLICCSFAHSLYAQSNQQLDFIINAPIAKLRTLEEAEKIEAVLENRDTDRFIKFWEKNAKKFGEHIIVLESISNYGSYGGGLDWYGFEIYDFDNDKFYSWEFGKMTKKRFKSKMDFPEKLNNSAYFNSRGVKDGALMIFYVINKNEQSFFAFYGGLGYPGSDPSIAADYEVMESFLLSLPMN